MSKKPLDLNEDREKVNPIFQIMLIAISMTILLSVLFWRARVFRADEKPPHIKPITPAKITEFGGFSGVVRVGLFIDQFQQFSIVGNDFTFDGIVWFKFNPGEISLDTIEKFSFENGTLLYRSPPDARIEGDLLLARYNIRLQFSTDLNYKEFPLDDHRIDIILTNNFIEPSEVFFKSAYKDFTVDADMSFRGWDEVDREVETGYIEAVLDPKDTSKNILRPAIAFSIDYSRTSVRYTLSILLPLALIFFLTLFSVSLPMKTAIASSAGGVTAILAYRFVIENLSPKVGFFMVSDFIFFLFLSLTLMVFVINVSESFGKWKLTKHQKNSVLILFHMLIIGVISYLIIW